MKLRPQEIQVGLLKCLRGTPIVRHDAEWGMVYSPYPPYEVLQTAAVDFAAMQRMRRFARYWDLIANSGNFVGTTPLLWRRQEGEDASPFESFLALSDWLFGRVGRNHSIALGNLAELLFTYLTQEAGHEPSRVGPLLWRDYRQAGRRDGPEFLRPYVSEQEKSEPRRTVNPTAAPARQARHLRGTH